MAQEKPEEKKDRNLEFYKRCWINGEDIYDLIREYDISYPRAYQIKQQVEDKYPTWVKEQKEIAY